MKTPTLSRRERQVLEMIAAGLIHAEIADRLRIAPGTVSSTATQVRDKLGANTSANAVHLAHQYGLLGGVA